MAQYLESSARLGRRFIFAMDDQLRRFERIYSFSQDPNCVLRISRSASHRDLTLADGTRIAAGDPMIELHWWNERIASTASGGSSLRWGMQFYRHTYYSLVELARYLDQTPELRDVVALHGETTFSSDQSQRHHANGFRRLGFELEVLPPARDPAEFVVLACRHFHVWLLTWACNPTSLHRRTPWEAVRSEVWISRQAFLERCLGTAGPQLSPVIVGRTASTPAPQPAPPFKHDGAPVPAPVPASMVAAPDAWNLLRAYMRTQYSNWRR